MDISRLGGGGRKCEEEEDNKAKSSAILYDTRLQAADCDSPSDGLRLIMLYLGSRIASFSLPETPFSLNMWMLGISSPTVPKNPQPIYPAVKYVHSQHV